MTREYILLKLTVEKDYISHVKFLQGAETCFFTTDVVPSTAVCTKCPEFQALGGPGRVDSNDKCAECEIGYASMTVPKIVVSALQEHSHRIFLILASHALLGCTRIYLDRFHVCHALLTRGMHFNYNPFENSDSFLLHERSDLYHEICIFTTQTLSGNKDFLP